MHQCTNILYSTRCSTHTRRSQPRRDFDYASASFAFASFVSVALAVEAGFSAGFEVAPGFTTDFEADAGLLAAVVGLSTFAVGLSNVAVGTDERDLNAPEFWRALARPDWPGASGTCERQLPIARLTGRLAGLV